MTEFLSRRAGLPPGRKAGPHGDAVDHLRNLARQALTTPAGLTHGQIQELGLALLIAMRDAAARHEHPGIPG